MIIPTITGEHVEMESVSAWTVRIKYRTADGEPGRGDKLARALHGRLATQPRAWWMTPARAAKWLTLYQGGWAAREYQAAGMRVWVFDRGEQRGIPLADAIGLTRSEERKRAARATAQQGAA